MHVNKYRVVLQDWLCSLKSSVLFCYQLSGVIKAAKIRNRYNRVPHLIQYTNGKVTNSQFDTTNESQEVSPFPAWPQGTNKQTRTKA